MPPDRAKRSFILPGPSTRGTEGGEHRKILIAPPDDARQHVQKDEARGRTWLSWRSHGCGHGLKSHTVSLDGSVREIGDISSKPAPRRKPKGVSSRRWRQA
jgi:hypothetical protein